MNIPSALSVAQITLYLAAVAALVSALITQFVQPLVNAVPALSPAAPDGTLRAFVLRGANLVLSVIGVLGLAAVAGQLSASTLVPTGAAIVVVAIGAHAAYKIIPPPAPTPPVSAPPSALQVAPAVSTPPTPITGMGLPDGTIVASFTPVSTSNAPAVAPPTPNQLYQTLPNGNVVPLHQQSAPAAPVSAI